jgi:hypothetical protein
MTTQEFIIRLFCIVDDGLRPVGDDQMPGMRKHPQARLWPSELVTVGLLFALKGGTFRAFYRWLLRDYAELFGAVPERTRLLRLLATHAKWCEHFLADPTFFTVLDSYGIELIHPIRQGRTPHQIGKKGKSNWRWHPEGTRGMKLCWLINDRGQVVAWDWNTANVHDQTFLPLIEPLVEQTIVLADSGFQDVDGVPTNLKLCPRGTWNERMLVETTLSLVTLVFGLKKVFHRTTRYFAARLAYVAALFNSLLALNRSLQPDASPYDLLHLAQYSL